MAKSGSPFVFLCFVSCLCLLSCAFPVLLGYVSISRLIGCWDRFWNHPSCVGWGYSLTVASTSIVIAFTTIVLKLMLTECGCDQARWSWLCVTLRNFWRKWNRGLISSGRLDDVSRASDPQCWLVGHMSSKALFKDYWRQHRQWRLLRLCKCSCRWW